jgi:uncharacterized phage infection (PIP) family protein YhgE
VVAFLIKGVKMEIGRSLDEIDAKVKKLNETFKQSTAQTRELDKALKLDPKSIEAAAQLMQNLQTQIGLATQKVASLKQKQIEVNKSMANGDTSAKEFQNAILQPVISKVNNLVGGFDKVSQSLKAGQKAMKVFSQLALSLVTTMAGLVTNFVKNTASLIEMAKAYDLNIEKLQIQGGIFKEITGDADNYNNSLNAMKKVIGEITMGQGTGYANILKHIGVSTADLNGKTKSATQLYEETVAALSAMEDITLEINWR